MQELLVRTGDLIQAHPGVMVGMVAVVMVAVLIWGVVFSSYR